MKERWPRESSEGRKILRVIMIVVFLLLGVIALYYVGQSMEKSLKNAEPRGDLRTRFTQPPTVEHLGAQYWPKEKLTTLLLMGIDQDSVNRDSSSFRNGGQADFLMLIVVDGLNKTITPIQIDRDTMAEVTVLGVLGNVTGMRNTQICLSHGFGDGREASCELTVGAVSRLLLGKEIDYYISVNLEGIATLNDAIGGVTVTLADDFSALDPLMKRGATLTLRGVQAEYFVRNRMDIGVGTNEARMVRQQVYWDGLSSRLSQRLQEEKNANFLGELFDTLKPYMVTDMKRGKMINELWNTRDYERNPVAHPVGRYAVGEDGFTEFHADSTAMEALVFDTFYRLAATP